MPGQASQTRWTCAGRLMQPTFIVGYIPYQKSYFPILYYIENAISWVDASAPHIFASGDFRHCKAFVQMPGQASQTRWSCAGRQMQPTTTVGHIPYQKLYCPIFYIENAISWVDASAPQVFHPGDFWHCTAFVLMLRQASQTRKSCAGRLLQPNTIVGYIPYQTSYFPIFYYIETAISWLDASSPQVFDPGDFRHCTHLV